MPSTSRQNNLKWNTRRELPPEPTCHLPGTEAKMRVMEERLEQGYHLHHPGDARVVEEFLDVPVHCLKSRLDQRVLKVGEIRD